MAKRTKLGAAGAAVLHHRTGGEALGAVTAAAPKTRARRPTLNGTRVTTIRFLEDQWAWLRKQAFDRALESGTKADASEIVRELVAKAMAETETKTPDRRR